MLNISKKVKAFTLTELLVVLVLTGIITGIVLTAYNLISGYFLTLERKSSSAVLLNTLYRSLQLDFETCAELQAQGPNSIICRGKQGEEVAIYSFTESSIKRQQKGLIDSLSCSVGDIVYKWNSKIVSEGLMDEILINVALQQRAIKFHVVKNHDVRYKLLKNDSSEWTRY